MALADLITFRDNIEAELAALDLRISYGADGRSFDHDGHRAQLVADLDDIEKRILKRQGAVEIKTQVLG